MAMAPEPFFFTPPPAPRHLTELRKDPAHDAIAFSAPCATDTGRKRRCLLRAQQHATRAAPFDPALNTPRPTPTTDFSFEPGLRLRHPTSAAGNMFAFLAALKQPNMPTGPTARGGFMFAASPEGPGPLTPTSRGSDTSSLTFLASPKQPLAPMGGSTATANEASLVPIDSAAAASLHSAKMARAGATGSVGFEFFPSPPGAAKDKETSLAPVGLGTAPFVFSASRSLPLPRGRSRKRLRPNLRVGLGVLATNVSRATQERT